MKSLRLEIFLYTQMGKNKMKDNNISGEKQNLALLCPVLLLLLTVPFLMSGCEPGGDLAIINRHIQEVRIFKSDVRNDGTANETTYQITIRPNETREFSITFIGPKHIQRIEAKDASGNVVFSHDYKMEDLEKIGWKITIPP